jgi:predicted  nucleic acid-binding Zn-ribbon protein
VTLRQTLQQVAKYEKQRNVAGGKKEYDALGAEMAAAKQACTRLEDEVLAAMSEGEERTAALPALEADVARAREEAARFEQTSRERRAQLEQLAGSAKDELAKAEAQLPEDAREQYNRLVAHRGEDALAALQGRHCAACYNEITAQMHNELVNGRFVLCKNCGRILYLPE